MVSLIKSADGVMKASISPCVDSPSFKKMIEPLLMIWLTTRVLTTTRKTEQKASTKWNFLLKMSLYACMKK